MIAPDWLRSLLDERGGFTVDPITGEQIARGVSVCVNPERSRAFPRAAWCDEAVAGWLADQWEILRRAEHYLGGWFDTTCDLVWLDVVRVLPSSSRDVALALAEGRGQHCVYDLDENQLVSTSGARR